MPTPPWARNRVSSSVASRLPQAQVSPVDSVVAVTDGSTPSVSNPTITTNITSMAKQQQRNGGPPGGLKAREPQPIAQPEEPQQVSMRQAPMLQLAGAGGYQPSNRRPPAGKKFSLEQLRATDGIVPSQYGSNMFASQKGLTGFGTPRNTTTAVVDNADTPLPGLEGGLGELDNATKAGRWTIEQLRRGEGIIRPQSGTNQFASQRGSSGFGAVRDVHGKHLHRIWELEYPEEAFGGQQQQEYEYHQEIISQ